MLTPERLLWAAIKTAFDHEFIGYAWKKKIIDSCCWGRGHEHAAPGGWGLGWEKLLKC